LKWPGRALLVLAACVLGAASASAAKPTERSKQKAAAEAARADIAQKLGVLKKDIGRTESEKEHAADALASSEVAISDAKRALRELAAEQADTNARLLDLGNAQQKLTATIATQQQQLAKLLREHYVAGNEDRIKLLLSGDNPNRINRDLQLMAYVSQAQAKLLTALRANLAQVDANRQDTENAKQELEEIALEQREQQALLEKEKARRAELLGSLSKRLVAQRKQAGNLERDEQRMAGLVDKLAKLIREQAEAAAAEKRRQEALAAAKAKQEAEAKAERLRIAKQNANNGKPGAKVVEPEEPKVVRRPADKPVDIALAPVMPDGAFARLRGQLLAPIAGKLATKFGSKNAEGASWKGVLIKAPEGSDVKAIAAGRVIYARWMRGLGNLLIVDHGNEYWSIYGNNQALLKREGDPVKAGELVASAGNTGGSEESGLYFEMRFKGSPMDPASWIKF
jgi:septal ring factor EnvC (AmiA/AmiB activator)